jgi:hypothetical protein
MIGVIKSWVLGVAAAAFIAGIAISLVPQGKMRRVVSLVCGFMTIAVMLGPLKEFDFGSYSSYLSEFQSRTENIGAELANENERLIKAIIEERSAAYILDKATQLEISDLKVTVVTKAGDGDYPYPWSVELGGEATEQQKRSLGRYMEAELGIPAERQHWSE